MKYLRKSAVTNMAVIQDVKVISDILNIHCNQKAFCCWL